MCYSAALTAALLTAAFGQKNSGVAPLCVGAETTSARAIDCTCLGAVGARIDIAPTHGEAPKVNGVGSLFGPVLPNATGVGRGFSCFLASSEASKTGRGTETLMAHVPPQSVKACLKACLSKQDAGSG